MSGEDQGLVAGTRVGHFQIDKVLGAGGFGITYLAHDLNLDRKVALKEFFPPDFARRLDDGGVIPKSSSTAETFEWALGRFSDEARLLARFRHPNIVPVNQLLPGINGTAYIVMDYLEGATLEACLKRDGLPSPLRLLTIFRQLLDGCEAIHDNQILHRDISPSNVMMVDSPARDANGLARAGREPTPVLIDFGASRKLAAQQRRGFSAIVNVQYSPPEQYSDKNNQSEASDIYALAATVYDMLTGHPPPTAAERHETPLPPVPPQRAAAFRPEFVPAVLKGLEIRMTDRPQTIVQWRAMLGPLEPKTEVSKGKRSTGWNRRKLIIAGGGGALAVAGVGATAAFLLRGNGPTGFASPLKIAWTKEFGALMGEPLPQIAATPGGAMVAAHRRSDDGNSHMLALSTHDDGATAGEWVDSEPGGMAHAILPWDDGGAFVGGTVGDTAVLARLGPDWQPVWRREVGAGAVKSILRSNAGLIVGLEAPGSSGAPLMSVDTSGNKAWEVSIERGANDSVERMVALEEGGYAVLGSGFRTRNTTEGSLKETFAWLALVDAQGVVRTRPETNGMGVAWPTAVIEVGGLLYVTGYTAERSDMQPDQRRLLVWAIDKNGAETWKRWDYPSVPSSGRSLSLSGKDKLYLAGWSGSPSRMRFAQIGPNGDLVWDDSPQTSTGNIAAQGLAMRAQGDGFAVGLSQSGDNQLRLVVSRLTAQG